MRWMGRAEAVPIGYDACIPVPEGPKEIGQGGLAPTILRVDQVEQIEGHAYARRNRVERADVPQQLDVSEHAGCPQGASYAARQRFRNRKAITEDYGSEP